MWLGCKMKTDHFLGMNGVKLIPGRFCFCCYFVLFCWFFFFLCFVWASTQWFFSPSLFRFSYIAICCLSLLHQLNKINVEKAVKYIVSCKNLDGGFGSTPGGESHAGQSKMHVYCNMLLRIIFFLDLYLFCYAKCVNTSVNYMSNLVRIILMITLFHE